MRKKTSFEVEQRAARAGSTGVLWGGVVRVLPRVLLAVSSLTGALCACAGDYIDAVQWVHWDDAPHFRRIAEYFTGHEYTRGKIVARTDPQTRAGWYCAVTLKQRVGGALQMPSAPGSASGPEAGAQPVQNLWSVRVHYWLAEQSDPLVHTFVLPGAQPPSKLLELGFTAGEWSAEELDLVAWRIELVDGAGQVVDSAQSYLWE